MLGVDLIKAASHGVSSPKSQHGGKVPTFEPQESTKIWLIVIKIESLIFYAKVLMGLVLRVGSCFWSPNSQYKSLA
jgi:hypothetical protein